MRSACELIELDGEHLQVFRLGDAIGIRNRIIDLLELAALLSKAERRALLTFVVAGGGLNGTEIAGELHDFILKALEDYPAMDPGQIRMVLIEMLDRLAQELPLTSVLTRSGTSNPSYQSIPSSLLCARPI